MVIGRRFAEVLLCLTLLAGFAAIQTGVGNAEAGTKAGCVGIEASAISPKGTSDEFPGGMPELNAFVRSLGVPQGTVYSSIAKLHEGSHEECDAATE